MGNTKTHRGPVTTKDYAEGESDLLKYAHCEMQGWRNKMVKHYNKGRCNDL